MSDFPKTLTLSRRSGQQICNKTISLSKTHIIIKDEAGEIVESLKLDHCYGVYLDDKLVAFTMMIDNRCSVRNYGNLVGYTPEQQRKCVSMEITIVDEPCRGYGLQRYFVELRERIARNLGATEAMVTIGPENQYSLRNLIKEGYEIIDTRRMYEGAMRHILRKKL